MIAWVKLRQGGMGIAFPLLLLVFGGSNFTSAAEPTEPTTKTAKPSVIQLRATAEAAEKSGDWDTAFTAYCHLFVADRGSPDIREKLNSALRRVQQLRRHRDLHFQEFASTVTVADAMKLYGEVLTKVPVLYVDRERATPQILWQHGIEELSRALGDPAFRQAFLNEATLDKVEGFRNALRMSWAKQPISNASEARLQLRKLATAAQESLDMRVPSALILEVVCGSCSGLDEYTVFLNPSQLNLKTMSSVPDLSAQGVYLGFDEGGLFISGIAPGSWVALHTPLRKGDRIAGVNGRSMEMATLAGAAEALRYPSDGFQELEIVPTNADSLPVVARLPVEVPTVFGTAVVNSKSGVGYTRIGSIAGSTPRELDEAIHWLKSRGSRVVVIDVRGNLGGSFLAGVDTAKRLIPAGLIVTTQGQLSQVNNQPFSSDSGMSAHEIPVVLLVDAETASAAEVLAAALKDHDRAVLVGMPTFGKGAIQYPLRLDSLDEKNSDGQLKNNKSGGVRLTIARLISPSGELINGVGITPHIIEADPVRQLEAALEQAVLLLQPNGISPMPAMPILPMIP